jgi:sugar phosphate isomerase/epimerase
MCFGYDGEGALRRSLDQKGASRRGLLLGATAGAAGLATLGTAGPAAADDVDESRASIQHRRISVQLWTLRDAITGQPGFEVVLTRLAQYGYERVELAGEYGGKTAAQLGAFLDGLGIRASSSHDGISSSSSTLATKLERAVILGQQYVVVPWLNPSPVLADWQMWADQMNAEAAEAKRWGLRYGYHNHAHEFTIDLGGGVTPWDVLTERLDPRLVHLEVDLYWAYTGGVNSGAADPLRFTIDVVRSAPQRVLQYHVKDRDGSTGDMCDLGTGVIDFPAIFRKHTVQEYIVENDTPDVSPLTSAAVGHLYLDHLRF